MRVAAPSSASPGESVQNKSGEQGRVRKKKAVDRSRLNTKTKLNEDKDKLNADQAENKELQNEIKILVGVLEHLRAPVSKVLEITAEGLKIKEKELASIEEERKETETQYVLPSLPKNMTMTDLEKKERTNLSTRNWSAKKKFFEKNLLPRQLVAEKAKNELLKTSKKGLEVLKTEYSN